MKWTRKERLSISISLVLLVASLGGVWYVQKRVTSSFHTVSILLETPKKIEIKNKTLKEIIQDTQKWVVKIESKEGIGSGFLYNDLGDIVTNAHVVANVKEVEVYTSDSTTYIGTVIGISEVTDVAVVRVPGLQGNSPLPLKRTLLEVGDNVLALGSPLGLQNTVTTGIISGVERDFNLDQFHYENMYQISAPIAPGNSGGPLVDANTGEVIGINSVKAQEGDIGFSLPITQVFTLIDGWIASPMTELPNIPISQ